LYNATKGGIRATKKQAVKQTIATCHCLMKMSLLKHKVQLKEQFASLLAAK